MYDHHIVSYHFNRKAICWNNKVGARNRSIHNFPFMYIWIIFVQSKPCIACFSNDLANKNEDKNDKKSFFVLLQGFVIIFNVFDFVKKLTKIKFGPSTY